MKNLVTGLKIVLYAKTFFVSINSHHPTLRLSQLCYAQPGQIVPDGESKLIIDNKPGQELSAQVVNWQLFPTLKQAIDTSISKGEKLALSIKTQG